MTRGLGTTDVWDGHSEAGYWMDPYIRFFVVFLSVWVVLDQIVFGFAQF